MKAIPKIIQPLRYLCGRSGLRVDVSSVRFVHSTTTKAAVAHPVNLHGPPPKPPTPAPGFAERAEQRKIQSNPTSSDSIKLAQGIGEAKPSPLKRRFWKDVHVKEVEDGYQVLLDTRAVRTPMKKPLHIPRSKPHLAHAIALEWDLLESAQQALKNHRIPLTSLTARAQDISEQDSRGVTTIRDEICRTVLRYFDTDTLLSWAPASNVHEPPELSTGGTTGRPETLRDLQIRTAQPIIAFLVNQVWPGVEIRPTLEEDSIVPVPQPQETKDVVRGWIAGLGPYELAGLERGVLASKSLLVAVRLVVEWSENFRHLQPRDEPRQFGIEKAAEASSLEVTWQTGRWGEVEDTHDVDREDLRRQLGSVVVLVSGETR
ncbi:hypothetical protein VTO42DRAFT_3713 [Malbranchea cinnamomea]